MKTEIFFNNAGKPRFLIKAENEIERNLLRIFIQEREEGKWISLNSTYSSQPFGCISISFDLLSEGPKFD